MWAVSAVSSRRRSVRDRVSVAGGSCLPLGSYHTYHARKCSALYRRGANNAKKNLHPLQGFETAARAQLQAQTPWLM
jgi:hypothetical protein